VPVFHDYHPPGELPPSVFRATLRDLDARRPGTAGVHLLDYVLGVGGSITCVLAARNEEAVRQYHAERGVPCGRVEPGRPRRQVADVVEGAGEAKPSSSEV
jgi:hypothetical protein